MKDSGGVGERFSFQCFLQCDRACDNFSAEMLALSVAASSFVVSPPLARHAGNPASRHLAVVLRDVTFSADLTVETEPFKPGTKPIGDFFTEPEALRILMSQAESSRRLDGGDEKATTQKWEVVTPIQFPGMVARSETPMDISVDAAVPRLTVSSGSSKTVCEGGPGWAQALLARIADFATTSSSNVVEVRDAPTGPAGSKVVVSTINLTVKLSIPTLLLPPFVPAGPFEKSGSESIQTLLEKDMAPTLSRFRDAYTSWAA
jgi:hypothetical protein